jgi:hypothetical protein
LEVLGTSGIFISLKQKQVRDGRSYFVIRRGKIIDLIPKNDENARLSLLHTFVAS